MRKKEIIFGLMITSIFLLSAFIMITPVTGASEEKASILGRWDVDPDPDPEPVDQTTPWGITRVNAIAAAAQVDESGVTVAIVDTGIDYNHPDLEGKFVWGWSYYTSTIDRRRVTVNEVDLECTIANPSACYDDAGHGTHVAGTIAAQDNEIGVIGVAPDVELYILKALDAKGSGSYTAIANAIVKATQGPDGVPGTNDDADVISMSLGGPSGTEELENAVNYALNYGVIVVCATGNDGDSTPSYPAAYPGVLKVGAMDVNNAIASFSNRGEDVFAPGVDVLSCVPGGTYESWAGTSMATPHVSAIAALAISAHPTYTNTQIFDLIVNSVDGYGMVNALNVV